MSHQTTEAEIGDTAFKPFVKDAADKLLDLINRHVAAQVAIASAKPSQFTDTASFKNFHRSLCERFSYVHDEKFWWRDLCSLEEHIAASVKPETLSDDTLLDLWASTDGTIGGPFEYARAIEQAHGITATTSSRDEP